MFRIEFKMRKISETLHVFKKYNDRSAKKISHVTSLDVTAKIAGDKKMACSVCMEEQEENADLPVALFISRNVILLCLGYMSSANSVYTLQADVWLKYF